MSDSSYLDRDYDTILARLVSAIQSDPVLRDAIDLQGGSPDRLFLVALATQGDRLSYLLNAAANETFLVRARQRENVIAHARTLAYELATARPATTTLRFTLRRPPREAGEVVGFTLRAGHAVQSDDGTVSFELDADRAVLPGETTADVAATEGRTLTESFAGVLAAEAPTGQRITLTEAHVIVTPGVAGRFEVTVDGVAWERVEHFLDSLPYSRHFRVERDAEDRATVIFGDSDGRTGSGARPAAGSTIQVAYRVGGGTRGNVRRGRLTRLVGPVRTEGGTAVDLAVSNPLDVTNGLDRESTAHGRAAATASLREEPRSITGDDCARHAETMPGVARAITVTHRQDPGIDLFARRVYAVGAEARTPSDPTSPSVAVALDRETCRALERSLAAGHPGLDVEVITVGGAPIHRASIAAQLTVARGADLAAAIQAGEDAIYRLFDPMARDGASWRVDFGRSVPRSAIVAALQSVPGVRRVVLTTPASDTTLSPWTFPAIDGSLEVLAMSE